VCVYVTGITQIGQSFKNNFVLPKTLCDRYQYYKLLAAVSIQCKETCQKVLSGIF